MSNERDLSGPEFFTCRPYACRLLKGRCLQRQELAAGPVDMDSLSLCDRRRGLQHSRCAGGCEQGREIKKELLMAGPKAKNGG